MWFVDVVLLFILLQDQGVDGQQTQDCSLSMRLCGHRDVDIVCFCLFLMAII